jgi:phospholipid/cholesterol/gamma-HCH transport system substrate-binding protein
LLGEQYIGVQAGFEEANWASGAVVTQTQSAVVLENLISQFLFNQTASGSGKDEQ